MCNLYKLMLNQAISRHLQFCTLTPSKSASLPSGTVICRNYNRFIYFTYCTVDYRVYLSRRGDSKKPGVCKLPISEIAFVAGWTHRLVVFSRFPETGFRSNVEEGTLGNRGRPKTQSFLKTLICLENLFLHTQYNRFCSI